MTVNSKNGLRITKILVGLFVSTNISLIISYLVALNLLNDKRLSVSNRIFYFFDYPLIYLFSLIIVILSFIYYSVKVKRKLNYIILCLLISGNLLFIIYYNSSVNLFNPW